MWQPLQEVAINFARLLPFSALLSATLAFNPAAAQAPPPTLVGTVSAAEPATLTLPAGGTIGSINVLTLGLPNQDYQFVSDGSCAVGQTYTPGQSCVVKYTFAPTHPGLRSGAVVLYDNSVPPNAIATTYLVGTGTGPQITFTPAKETKIPVQGLPEAMRLAIDTKGNLFVAEPGYSSVYEVFISGGYRNKVNLGSGFNTPKDVAIDGAGNLFVADTGNNAIKEIVASSAYTTTLTVGLGFLRPNAVAVDAAGNVFVADTGNRLVKEIVAAGGYQTIKTLFSTSNYSGSEPFSLAVDPSDNLFFVTAYSNTPYYVWERTAASGYSTETAIAITGSYPHPYGLAVDGTGNLFVTVASQQGQYVEEFSAPGGPPTILASDLTTPYGLTVGGRGNVFVVTADGATSTPRSIWELHFSDPPSLAFPDTDAGFTNGPTVVNVSNYGNQPLQLSDIAYPPDFPEAPGSQSDCTSSLAAGYSCPLTVDFSPLRSSTTGLTTPLSEAITITDNSLNVPDAVQQVATSGNAIFLLPALTSPPKGSIIASTATFTWSPGSANDFQFRLGTKLGSNDIYGSGPTNSTSETVTGIPTNGETIYARLYYQINGGLQYFDYTYKAAIPPPPPPALTSPMPGTTLPGPAVTFSWTPGSATTFQFFVGTTLGTDDLYYSGVISSTSVDVSNLPINGHTIYARLYYVANSAWQYIDYTYSAEFPAPNLTSPPPGSTLTGSTVTFSWNAEAATTFQFRLGSKLGSNDIYGSGETTRTSVTAYYLPTNGEIIYARLYFVVNGAWRFNDYTYKAQ